MKVFLFVLYFFSTSEDFVVVGFSSAFDKYDFFELKRSSDSKIFYLVEKKDEIKLVKNNVYSLEIEKYDMIPKFQIRFHGTISFVTSVGDTIYKDGFINGWLSYYRRKKID